MRTCFPQKPKKRQIDAYMHAVVACYPAEFNGKILPFWFQFYYDFGRSKFHRVARFPATVLPEENLLWSGKTGCTKTRTVNLSTMADYHESA